MRLVKIAAYGVNVIAAMSLSINRRGNRHLSEIAGS